MEGGCSALPSPRALSSGLPCGIAEKRGVVQAHLRRVVRGKRRAGLSQRTLRLLLRFSGLAGQHVNMLRSSLRPRRPKMQPILARSCCCPSLFPLDQTGGALTAVHPLLWVNVVGVVLNQDLPAVRDLALVYTLAGADCIDVAAEEAVIEAAR